MMRLAALLVILVLPNIGVAADDVAPVTSLSDFKKFRDPFKEPETPVDASDELSDLEKYSTPEFKLLGVMSGPVRMRAMIGAPNGRSYVVSEKMKLGQREGVISRITTRSVIVTEKIVNPLGEVELVDTELNFQANDPNSGGGRR